jgi:hypothetical protein
VVYSAKWLPKFCKPNWDYPIPILFCDWHMYLSSSMILVSIITYITIAFERYLVIVHPMKFTNALGNAPKSSSSGGGSKKLLVIAGIWLFTAVYELPNLRYRHVLVHEDHSNISSPINKSATGTGTTYRNIFTELQKYI